MQLVFFPDVIIILSFYFVIDMCYIILYMPFYCLFNLLSVIGTLPKFTAGNKTVNGKGKFLMFRAILCDF